MFLNWVYRTNIAAPIDVNEMEGIGKTKISDYFTNSVTAPSKGCVPLEEQTSEGGPEETWMGGGFYNRAPQANMDITNAPFDWALSGDIRQALMNDIMNTIFSEKRW